MLEGWINSIVNHVYWSAVSSKDGDMMVAKFLSVCNHVFDVHENHHHEFPECEKFKKCAHADYTTEGKRKNWLDPGN